MSCLFSAYRGAFGMTLLPDPSKFMCDEITEWGNGFHYDMITLSNTGVKLYIRRIPL